MISTPQGPSTVDPELKLAFDDFLLGIYGLGPVVCVGLNNDGLSVPLALDVDIGEVTTGDVVNFDDEVTSGEVALFGVTVEADDDLRGM